LLCESGHGRHFNEEQTHSLVSKPQRGATGCRSSPHRRARPNRTLCASNVSRARLGRAGLILPVRTSASFCSCCGSPRSATVWLVSRIQETWEYRRDWASGRIRSENRRILLKAVGITSVFVCVSVFSVPVIRQQLSEGRTFPYWALITPVIALGSVTWSVFLFWGWRKFNESYFNLASMPGRIGGILSGVIETTKRIPDGANFRLRLSCINRIVSGYGRNRSVQNKVLWRHQLSGVRQESHCVAQGSEILVEFSIPVSCRESDKRWSRDQIIWYLEVSADLPGKDYAAIFEVPVFRPRADSWGGRPENSKKAKRRLKKSKRKIAKQCTQETGAPTRRD